MLEHETVSFKEKISFSLAGLGQNLIYNFSSAYIIIFYTDFLKLLPAAVGTLMLIARLWDAINDPLMGSLVDKTKTRFGKLRPYLLAVPIPLATFTILTFINVDMSYSMRLLYAYVTYISWGMIYTVSDVPYWGLSAAMTTDPKQRLSIISLARIFCNIGLAIAIVIPPIIISLFKGTQMGYTVSAIIMGVLGSFLFFLAFFNTKERVVPSSHDSSILNNLSLIKHNKPLLLLQSSRVLGALRMGLAAAGTYFAKYNLGNELYFSVLGGILILSMISAITITPLLSKSMNKKFLYQASLLIGAFAHLAMFIFGYSNMVLLFGFLFIAGFGMGVNDVIMYSMVTDSIDYLEFKTKKRLEGVSFSLHTFTTKLQTAISAFVIGLVLQMFGFVENVAQSEQTLTGIFLLLSILPAIASLLSLIPMHYYDLSEDKHKKILEQL